MSFPYRAPLGVTATIDLQDKVTVSWQAVSGALSYNVYKSSTPTTAGATLLATGVSGTSYDDTTLAAETVRYYFVMASGVSGSSNYSGMATGWIVMPPPDAPSLSYLAYPGLMYLEWDRTSRALFYEIYRDGSFVARVQDADFSAYGYAWYEDEDITPHVDYVWQVFAGNFSGLTGSNTIEDHVNDPVPGAPTGLTATDGAYPSKVVIEWDSVVYAATYNIYRNTTSGASTLLASGITDTSYEDIVASGENYYYRVKAVGESGTSGFSNEDTGYAGGLAAPTTTVASDDELDVVEVSWTGVTGATKYNLYRNGFLLASDLTALFYDDDTPTPGVDYLYQVQAANTVESSGLSSGDYGRRIVIDDPASVSATDDDETGVTVSWDFVTDALSYKVFRDGTLLASGLTGYTYFDNSVSDCVIYNYTVKAVRNDNESAGSVGDNGHKLPTGDLCENPGGNSTTTGADAADGYVFCGNPTVSWHFNAYTAADSFDIYLDGGLVVSLGSVTGTHSGSFAVGGGPGVHTILVVVNHGTGSTQWDYDISC